MPDRRDVPPRVRRLIVTGDDFGLSRAVNRAIVEAYRRGVLTSASLMVTGEAWREAVELARENPGLAIGLHLVLLDGKPVLPPSEIPELVDRSGSFRPSPFSAGLRYALRRRARAELREEIRAQLARFHETGLKLSHVDGHHHFHLHPAVLSCLVSLSREYPIPAIRLPREELALSASPNPFRFASGASWSWIFGRLRRHGERLLRGAGIAYADRVYGLLATGEITEDYLLELLPRIRAENVEIYSHPTIAGPGNRELDALLSPLVRSTIEACGFSLSGHRDLGALSGTAGVE